MKKTLLLIFILLINKINFSQSNLWGMITNGGANSEGVIFKYDFNSNVYTKTFDFNSVSNSANARGSFLLASDGKVYGLTVGGGLNGSGTIFQYDIVNQVYTKKQDLSYSSGYNPSGTLIQASNSFLYGLTQLGGINNNGVLFQYDLATNVYTKKVEFDGASIGSEPLGSLIEAADGNLYGMTNTGGANNYGTLFQYNVGTNTLIKKIDFSSSNGGNPRGSLLQATDGKLYGLTATGGVNNMGTLFQYDPNSNVFTKKIDFDGTTKGSTPYGSLIQLPNGDLYGFTSNGGLSNAGVLFQYNITTNTYNKKLDFDILSGSHPYGSLILASDGKLYGMAGSGGFNSRGVIFQYDFINDIYIDKIDFLFSGIDGYHPFGNNFIEISSSTGINESKSSINNITICPNPTNGLFTLNSNANLQKIEILTITGQVLMTEIAVYNNYNFNIEALSNGIYFINVYQNNRIVKREKIVLNK